MRPFALKKLANSYTLHLNKHTRKYVAQGGKRIMLVSWKILWKSYVHQASKEKFG
jgi:hypothetical protein